jgi:hypothetical protein
MIHSNVWTTKTKSIGGCKYYVSFIDDHTKKVWVYFMKHKGELFQHFLNFKTMVEKEKGVSIKCQRFDGGGKYFSKEFCRNPTLAKCGGEAQHLEKTRIWSPPGLPNVQSSTERLKTPRIEVFLVSLERS